MHTEEIVRRDTEIEKWRARWHELDETLGMLLQLEPALNKYRIHPEESDVYYLSDLIPQWDTEKMKAALEFRRLRDASTEYEEKVVGE